MLSSSCSAAPLQAKQRVVTSVTRHGAVQHGSRCRASASSGRSFRSEDEFMREALHEAATIYSQAKQLSDNQVRRELMDTWISGQKPRGATADTVDTSSSASNSQFTSFWLEQGLTDAQAERVTRELLKQDPQCDLAVVAAKLNRLYRILPEANVPLMVYKDTSILDADASVAVRNLVVLVEEFSSGDVIEMVTKLPSILALPNLQASITHTVEKLTEIHPSKSEETVKAILEEHPQLIARMEYYSHVTMIDELPIEIQNMMIIADQGLGFLHRYYRNKNAQNKPSS